MTVADPPPVVTPVVDSDAPGPSPPAPPAPSPEEGVTETTVTILGAGPYGVAIANRLWDQGSELFIAGDPFVLWREHTPDTMFLRSDERASAVPSPDGRYGFTDWLAANRDGDVRSPETGRVPVEHFRAYLEDVARRLPYPVHRHRAVRLERFEPLGGLDGDDVSPRDALVEGGHRFLTTFADGTRVASRAVVVATGLGAHQHVPESLAHLPPERLVHSWHTDRYHRVEGRRVLVVGMGQSAGEAVQALRRNNRVTWLLRREPLFLSEPLRLPTPLFKLVMGISPLLYRLPPAILRTVGNALFRTTMTPDLKTVYEDPEVTTVFGDAADLAARLEPRAESRTSGADAGTDAGASAVPGPVVTDLGGPFDLVVAATGYRFSLHGLPFLSDDLIQALGGDPDTVPPLDRYFETPVPGLHLAGGIAGDSFGPSQRFIWGARQAALRLGQVAGRLASGRPSTAP